MSDAIAHVALVLDSPAEFSDWWERRARRADRAIVQEAERRGLIIRTGGLIVLTAAGKALRASRKTD